MLVLFWEHPLARTVAACCSIPGASPRKNREIRRSVASYRVLSEFAIHGPPSAGALSSLRNERSPISATESARRQTGQHLLHRPAPPNNSAPVNASSEAITSSPTPPSVTRARRRRTGTPLPAQGDQPPSSLLCRVTVRSGLCPLLGPHSASTSATIITAITSQARAHGDRPHSLADVGGDLAHRHARHVHPHRVGRADGVGVLAV